ncbi:hypothetical protein JKP88DRAFT_279869 [Tribonema minus]|uniref:Uncharacterized protein n=1 Tax=Tribonema minus TaxID=303371 RepID=A0A835YZR1_9STRA|nr:hypothetical protein JKP88DRAFT_279869 [Tribonema minus]
MTSESGPAEGDEYVNPEKVAITLPDVTEFVLQSVSSGLKEPGFLADADPQDAKFPLLGVVRGPWWRPFVVATVTNEFIEPPISKRVVFLVDTTVPVTYLSTAILDALGFGRTPRSLEVNVHGIRVPACRSAAGFADANVLGTIFFRRSKLTLVVNFATIRVEAQLQAPNA